MTCAAERVTAGTLERGLIGWYHPSPHPRMLRLTASSCCIRGPQLGDGPCRSLLALSRGGSSWKGVTPTLLAARCSP